MEESVATAAEHFFEGLIKTPRLHFLAVEGHHKNYTQSLQLRGKGWRPNLKHQVNVAMMLLQNVNVNTTASNVVLK